MGTEFNLGDKVRDKVTGFEGTVTAKNMQVHAPTNYCVEALVNGEHKGIWFHDQRLVLVAAANTATV